MTRINVGYPVKKLTTRHLLSEHREIVRIPNMVKSGKAKIDNIPEHFSLGKGHVKFFYNKLGYLLSRYYKVYAECVSRQFNVQDYSSAWNGIPKHLLGGYVENKHDTQLIIDRINSKIK